MKSGNNSNGKGYSPRNCFSERYRENYDSIFRKTPQEWAKYLNIPTKLKSNKRISESEFLDLNSDKI